MLTVIVVIIVLKIKVKVKKVVKAALFSVIAHRRSTY